MPSDTDPRVQALIDDGYRRMSPAQKLARVVALTQAVEQLAMADVRARNPDASERELCLRVASRRLAPELMRSAFGWDPVTRGH